jgi:hypothetical protein
MAQFANVVPPQVGRVLKEFGMLGDYHLLLAHDVVKRPKEYEELYQGAGYVILDNSVIELGESVDIMMIAEAAEIVQPNVIVLPDVMKNYEGTIQLSGTFMERLMGLRQEEWPWIHSADKMGVAQGRNPNEFEWCTQELAMRGWAQHIALPRLMVEVLGDRSNYVYHLWSVFHDTLSEDVARNMNLHLLGFSDNLDDDFAAAQNSLVMGIDSAVPVRAGIEKISFFNERDMRRLSDRGDFWEIDVRQLDHFCWGYVQNNLDFIRIAIRPRG